MRIIGIDPGTGTTGFGVIDSVKNKQTFVAAGVIKTLPDTPLPERLKIIFDDITELIAEYKPSVMSVEKLYFAQNVTTGIAVAHARGAVLLAGQQADLLVAEYSPLEIKQAMTGYGRATKAQMQEMVKVMLKLKKRPSPDDAADGLAAALTHAQQLKIL